MKNVIFYGASVTHQSGDSGYFMHVEGKLSKLGWNAARMTYPSSQLSNAGFFNLMNFNAKEDSLDLVVLEWSTTSESSYSEKKLKVIFEFFLSKKIPILILVLPQRGNYLRPRLSESQMYDAAVKYKTGLIDLRALCLLHEFSDLVRDDVHTKDLGALLYASCIENYFKSNDFEVVYECSDYEPPIFACLANDLLLKEGEILNFEVASLGPNAEIAIDHIIGPFTPIVEIRSSNGNLVERTFFDPWCHYERQNFNGFLDFENLKNLGKEFSISISKKIPDQSILKQPVHYDGERYLKISNIYAYNCSIKII